MKVLSILNRHSKKPLRIFTWHIHGSYLYYLSKSHNIFILPVKTNKEEGYNGRSGYFPWEDNVIEKPASQIKNTSFDIILFQSKKNYLYDQYETLSEAQRTLPKIYLEHDPPRQQPTNTSHIVNDPNTLLVHVTHFNNLMWDSGETPTQVINHGVSQSETEYKGEIKKGIVVINNLFRRGRRLGNDIYQFVRKHVPLDLIGIDSERYQGLGDIRHDLLPQFISRYRFFFNPIRYTSLPLSLCEAMMVGMPIVALSTTEVGQVIENNVSGYTSTDVNILIEKMHMLLDNVYIAKRMGKKAKQYAIREFSIKRFTKEWEDIFERVANRLILPGEKNNSENNKLRSAVLKSQFNKFQPGVIL